MATNDNEVVEFVDGLREFVNQKLKERKMKMTTANSIDFWHDETSDPEYPVWVVSLNDEQGSRTLKAFADEARARDHAVCAAYARGLPVFTVDKFGARKQI